MGVGGGSTSGSNTNGNYQDLIKQLLSSNGASQTPGTMSAQTGTTGATNPSTGMSAQSWLSDPSSIGNSIKDNAGAFANPIGAGLAAIGDPINGMIQKGADQAGNLLGGGGNNAQAPQLPGVTAPFYAGDAAAIGKLGANIDNLYNNQKTANTQTYNDQAAYETAGIDKQMKDMITNLTSSDPNSLGGQLQGGYNRLGLLNSGAFNQGLASQFTPIEQQATTDILNQGQQQFGDLRNINTNQVNTGIGLQTGGLQRQFGNEDWFRNAQQQQQLAQLGVNSQTSIANQQGQNQLLGSGIGAAGALGSAAMLK